MFRVVYRKRPKSREGKCEVNFAPRRRRFEVHNDNISETGTKLCLKKGVFNFLGRGPKTGKKCPDFCDFGHFRFFCLSRFRNFQKIRPPRARFEVHNDLRSNRVKGKREQNVRQPETDLRYTTKIFLKHENCV